MKRFFRFLISLRMRPLLVELLVLTIGAGILIHKEGWITFIGLCFFMFGNNLMISRQIKEELP